MQVKKARTRTCGGREGGEELSEGRLSEGGLKVCVGHGMISEGKEEASHDERAGGSRAEW